MNHPNQNLSYSPFPWLEETLKNYQENIDYKIEYLNGYKHYTLLSDRLKKFVEEEWHQKRVKPSWEKDGKANVKNVVKWMKEELLKYQEGVDYQIKKTARPSGMVEQSYKVLSEKMKKGIDNWNDTQVEDNSFSDFAHWFFHPGSADYHRQQEWEKKKVEAERRKFIAENDPPLFRKSYLHELTEKEKLFDSQQGPLTEAEKTALNDPSLTYLGDWAEVLWYIQKNRQANLDLYPDKYFAWEGDSKLKGRVLEVIKKAGVPLDKLFQRVEKGRQIKLRQVREKAQQDKATILANLNDWIVSGSDSIQNWKTTQNLALRKDGNITRHRFYFEYAHGGKDSEEGIVDGWFDPATFQKLRTAIFQNMLKNLRENKNYSVECQKKCGRKIFESENYSPTEWTEIQKAMGKAVPVSENSDQNSPNNSSLRSKLIVASVVVIVLIFLILGGIFLVRKRKKSRSKDKL